MWWILYNLGLIAASPLIVLVLLAKKRCRPGLWQRMGKYPARLRRDDRPVIWTHAVSLGEVVAVAPLLRALHGRFPGHRFLVSTVTETGREAVENRLAGIAEHCYAPLDFPWVARRAVEYFRPGLYLFVETELWPNVLRAVAARQVPAIMVNGRLSSRSFSRYVKVRRLMAHVLRLVTCFLMQSDRDVTRIIALGADPSRVVRVGNLKFDQPTPPSSGTSLTREGLGFPPTADLLVAGSTHPGEEPQLLDCFRRLRGEFPHLVLVLAPRHIERATEVEATVRLDGWTVRRRSASVGTAPAPDVVVLDTRGELALLYREATLAYVGGTLVAVGGHNLLEPAAWGKAVFFGPHTDHCAEIASQLLQAGAGVRVEDGAQLATEMATLLRDRARLAQAGAAGRKVIEENRGAVNRSVEQVEAILASTTGPSTALPGRTPAFDPNQATVSG